MCGARVRASGQRDPDPPPHSDRTCTPERSRSRRPTVIAASKQTCNGGSPPPHAATGGGMGAALEEKQWCCATVKAMPKGNSGLPRAPHWAGRRTRARVREPCTSCPHCCVRPETVAPGSSGVAAAKGGGDAHLHIGAVLQHVVPVVGQRNAVRVPRHGVVSDVAGGEQQRHRALSKHQQQALRHQTHGAGIRGGAENTRPLHW